MNQIVPNPKLRRLTHFGLTTQDIDRLVRFFVLAFDCREIARGRRSGSSFEQSMRVRGGATFATLQLGDASIEVLEFDYPGKPFVPNLSAYDNRFQHFALVVKDMDAAFSRLSSVAAWSAISTTGPQHLPPSSGCVTAFKFRDPDGHPLELLRFPQDKTPIHWRDQPSGCQFLGIDHSAVSCANAGASIEFYQNIGLMLNAQSFNQGIEQECLDGIASPQLDLITLVPQDPTPHVELLCYRNRPTGRASALQSNDIGATRLHFDRDTPLLNTTEVLILDPDGHHLLVSSMLPWIDKS